MGYSKTIQWAENGDIAGDGETIPTVSGMSAFIHQIYYLLRTGITKPNGLKINQYASRTLDPVRLVELQSKIYRYINDQRIFQLPINVNVVQNSVGAFTIQIEPPNILNLPIGTTAAFEYKQGVWHLVDDVVQPSIDSSIIFGGADRHVPESNTNLLQRT